MGVHTVVSIVYATGFMNRALKLFTWSVQSITRGTCELVSKWCNQSSSELTTRPAVFRVAWCYVRPVDMKAGLQLLVKPAI